MIPLTARPSDLRKVYLASPANRPGRSKSTGHLAEADPGPEPADVPVALRHRVQQVHHLPVHQAEVAGVGRHVMLGHPLEQAVVGPGQHPFERPLPLPAGVAGVDHLVALAPLLHEQGEHQRSAGPGGRRPSPPRPGREE